MRTLVELEGPILAQPIEDVFEFVGNLENSPRWGRTRKTVKESDGPPGTGTTFREEARILGEKVKLQTELTGLETPTRLSYVGRFENGVIERTRIMLAAVEGGTRTDLAVEVEIDRIPQLFAPLVSLAVKQRIGAWFRKLEKEFAPSETSPESIALLIAIGAVLLATAGMRYLIEVLPAGEWRTVLALLMAALVAGGLAAVVWQVGRRESQEEDEEPAPAGGGPADAES